MQSLNTETNKVYGVTTKGNGDAFISAEKHTSLSTGGGEAGQGYPCVLEDKCLNPWDVQSKHIQPENGIAESLYSGECRGGGGESYVMCLNDQGGSQMGITENQTGTLRAQEHGHQPCVLSNKSIQDVICIEGNGDRPSHRGDGYKESEKNVYAKYG